MWRRAKTLLTGFGVLSVLALSTAIVANQIGGGRLLSVQSGSMEPGYSKGDLVNVNRVSENQIGVGDVITFINPQDKRTTITHRVIALNPSSEDGNTIITKGDANERPDTPIEASSIVGRVGQKVPYAGYAIDFIHSWPGLIILIYIPTLLIVLAELKRMSAYFRSQQPYVLAGYGSRRLKRYSSKSFVGAKYVLMFVALTAFVVFPTWAALQRTATLTGNTITIADIPEPPQPPSSGSDCTITNPEPNSTNTCTNNTTTNCTVLNQNNTDISNSSNQTATSGNARSSNNTQGGSASSGTAGNSSSSNTNVEINNNQQDCSSTTQTQP